MTFNPDDYDSTAFIVGGGPSLKGFNWELLDGKFVVAINRSYEVLPNAQIVYFTDQDFWQRHKDPILQHTGKKIRGVLRLGQTNDPNVEEYWLSAPTGLATEKGKLAHGSNSSYAAIQLCTIQFGFKNVYLLGIDMKWGQSGVNSTSHWHSGYKAEGGRTDGEHTYKKMLNGYKVLAPLLSERGFNIYNINTPDGTDLTDFPIVSVNDVFLT